MNHSAESRGLAFALNRVPRPSRALCERAGILTLPVWDEPALSEVEGDTPVRRFDFDRVGRAPPALMVCIRGRFWVEQRFSAAFGEPLCNSVIPTEIGRAHV